MMRSRNPTVARKTVTVARNFFDEKQKRGRGREKVDIETQTHKVSFEEAKDRRCQE